MDRQKIKYNEEQTYLFSNPRWQFWVAFPGVYRVNDGVREKTVSDS